MEELESRKEELLKKIKDAEAEKEMGALIDDQAMIDQAEEKISQYQEVLKEIEDALKDYQEKQAMEAKKEELRGEIASKYNEQYDYYRIITMSEEEAKEQMKNLPNPALDEINGLKQELQAKSEEFNATAEKIIKIEEEIANIKQEFLQTHDMSLFERAKELQAEKQALLPKRDELSIALEEINTKIENVEIQQPTVEEFKQAELNKLEGNYREVDGPTNKFISERQAEGKTISEITSELNSKFEENEQSKKLDDYMNSASFKAHRSVINKLSGRNGHIMQFNEYTAIWDADMVQPIIESINDILSNPNVDNTVKGYANSLMQPLNNLKNLYEQYNSLSSQRNHMFNTSDDHTLFWSKEYRAISDETDRIEEQIVRLNKEVNGYIQIICVAAVGKINEGYKNATGHDYATFPTIQEHVTLLNELDRNRKEYEEAKKNRPWDQYNWSGTKEEAENKKYREDRYQEAEAKMESTRDRRDKIFDDLDKNVTYMIWAINGYGYDRDGKSNRREISSDVADIANELDGITESTPGKYTEADIEKYIAEIEYVKEASEKAKEDSSKEKEKLTAPVRTEEPTLEDKDRKELDAMMSEAHQINSMQNTTGSVK